MVNVEGQYFITPQAATVMRNANRATTNTQATVPDQSTTPATQMVWLSATGEKYHSINNCGNMNPKKSRQENKGMMDEYSGMGGDEE